MTNNETPVLISKGSLPGHCSVHRNHRFNLITTKLHTYAGNNSYWSTSSKTKNNLASVRCKCRRPIGILPNIGTVVRLELRSGHNKKLQSKCNSCRTALWYVGCGSRYGEHSVISNDIICKQYQCSQKIRFMERCTFLKQKWTSSPFRGQHHSPQGRRLTRTQNKNYL